MILGSHNSMTYLKPKRWWMWLGRFMAKCQKVDYKQQYELGVRFFDFRISFDKHNHPQFSHGLMNFVGEDINDVLNYLNKKSDVYCRIVLEKGDNKDWFVEYVTILMTKYKNIKYIQIAKKQEWINLVEESLLTPLPYSLINLYASCNGNYPQYQKLPSILRSKSWSGLLIDDLYPWIYAKLNNKKNFNKYKDTDNLLLLDFVEIN